MKTKWIVVANRTQAKIFKENPFVLLKTLENPLGREKNLALRTDKPGSGKSQYSKSAGIHSMTGEKDPHEEAAIQFARELSRYLEHQGEQHRFDELVVAAEPKMMGRIRKTMALHLSETVQWIQKDFGHLSDYQIGKSLGITNERKYS